MSQMHVIKIGGQEAEQPAFLEAVAVYMQNLEGEKLIVHGGGKEISALCQQWGVQSEFRQGHRVTCAQTLHAAEMVLSGTANKRLVRFFLQKGFKALGVSGSDLGLIQAQIKRGDQGEDWGLVGIPEKVDHQILNLWADLGWLPIIAPIGLGPNYTALNINADLAAAAVAASVNAVGLHFLTAVNGVQENGGRLSHLNAGSFADLLANQIVTDGMIPKLEAG
ncbi:MAG: acetylglutamate kinase, partial [Acidobacteria bacterium]|nr:acetylglutamate kinase [Acidobacteriota bacterium]